MMKTDTERIDYLEKLVQSLVIAYVGIENLNEPEISIVGDAVRHTKDRAQRFRFNRQMEIEKEDIKQQIQDLQRKLEDYP